MQISPARRAAFEILRRVADESAYSSVLLAGAAPELGAKDRGLCHELVLGTLRRQLWLDRSIEHFAGRKIESLDLPVILSLRIGLYQLQFLARVPASAAINESVNLVKAARVKSAATFVNAILRRATREANYDPSANASDALEKLAIETSHPLWLITQWAAQFGFDEAAAIARANNEPGGIAFRFTAKALVGQHRSPDEVIDELRAAGALLIESPLAPGAWRLGTKQGDSTSADRETQTRGLALLRTLADEGLIYFQDEGSQMVAQMVGSHDGERLLDVCAAPGSKSTLIAATAPQCRITAADLYEHRVLTMKGLVAHQQATNIDFVVHDATQGLPFPPRSFDRVMVDAPCSGTGTLRHNPEIRWRLRPPDFADLRDKQQRILGNAAQAVKAGGRLLYSTCSLETEENEAVAGDFVNQHNDFEAVSLSAPAALLTPQGAVRTWPHRDDIDGFFAAEFRRVC